MVYLMDFLLLYNMLLYRIKPGQVGQIWSNTTEVNYAKFSAHCFSDLIDGFSTANQNLTTLDHYWASGTDTLYNTTQVNYSRFGDNCHEGTNGFITIGQNNNRNLEHDLTGSGNTTQVNYTRLGGNERIGILTGSYTMSGQRVDEYMEIFGSDKTQK